MFPVLQNMCQSSSRDNKRQYEGRSGRVRFSQNAIHRDENCFDGKSFLIISFLVVTNWRIHAGEQTMRQTREQLLWF